MFLFPQFKTRCLQSIPTKGRKEKSNRRLRKFFRRFIFVKRSLVELFLRMYVYHLQNGRSDMPDRLVKAVKM